MDLNTFLLFDRAFKLVSMTILMIWKGERN